MTPKINGVESNQCQGHFVPTLQTALGTRLLKASKAHTGKCINAKIRRADQNLIW